MLNSNLTTKLNGRKPTGIVIEVRCRNCRQPHVPTRDDFVAGAWGMCQECQQRKRDENWPDDEELS